MARRGAPPDLPQAGGIPLPFVVGRRVGPDRGAASVTDDRANGQAPAPGATTTAPGGLSDADLAIFLDLSAEIFAVYHPTDGLIWWNPAFPAALGFTDQEFSRLDIVEHIHADDVAGLDTVVRSLGRGEAVSGIETRYRAKDGSWRWWEWTAAFDRSTGLVYGAARDTTRRRAATSALRTSQHSLQAIIDNSPSSIFAKDLDGRYVLVNNLFLRALGMERERVLGRTADEIWPGLPVEPDADHAVTETGISHTSDVVIELSDGPHTFIMTRFPLSTDGRPLGSAGIGTDITERTRAEVALLERERLLETVERASPDIILVIDPTGAITSVSEACEQILGLARGSRPEQLEAALHPDDAPAWRAALAALRDDPAGGLDLRVRIAHADGHWVTLHARGRAVEPDSGTAPGCVVVARDVSEDLEFEEQLSTAVQTAELASRSKSQFLSRMSHELRTPLNSVLGFAQLLDMENLHAAQAEAVSHILRGGHHLLDLIDEALDISRIETGRVDLTLGSVPVDSVVSDAVNLARPLAERAGVSIETDLTGIEGVFALADRQRLLQVLLNLLSNAVKYNHPGGRVALSGETAGAVRLRLRVADTGQGIPADRVHRVFDPFDRLGAENTRVEGTGVGLTLSKQLVENMGGTISVVSRLGEGSTFTVELGVAAPADDERAPTPPETTARVLGRPVRVLYIEDNPSNRQLLQYMLAERPGVELTLASTGLQGLELARSEHPDVVILDLDLPDLTGEEVLAELRDDEDTAVVPVVILSADATGEANERLRELGVVRYLTKPIEVGHVIEVVDAARRREWT
jgi:PAS domain S-box-containing protein